MADDHNIRVGFDGPPSKRDLATRDEVRNALRGNIDAMELTVACAIASDSMILTYLAQAANLMARENRDADEAVTRMGFALGRINRHIEEHVDQSLDATNTSRMLHKAACNGHAEPGEPS